MRSKRRLEGTQLPKILVVDDDEHFRAYVTVLLQRAGYEVRTLGDGRGVAALLDREPIDAIVTDLYMPFTDGIEIVCAVRRRRPDLPIIGITGGGATFTESCIEAMRVLGASNVVSKPLDVPAFLKIVQHALRKNPGDRQS